MIRTLIKIFLMPSCCLCTIVYVGDAEPNNCTMTKRIVIIGFPVHWLHLQSLVTGGTYNCSTLEKTEWHSRGQWLVFVSKSEIGLLRMR